VIENCDTINLNLDSRLACEARPAAHEIGNPKPEIRNKFKIQIQKIRNDPPRGRPGVLDFPPFGVFQICFALRASDFEFHPVGRASQARRLNNTMRRPTGRAVLDSRAAAS
jgi:hypothetical protein